MQPGAGRSKKKVLARGRENRGVIASLGHCRVLVFASSVSAEKGGVVDKTDIASTPTEAPRKARF